MEMTGIRLIDELELAEKRVFIRCDFNVPQDEDGNITDDARIQAALPTIRKALNEGAFVILASHLGRPKGKPDAKYSMKPVGHRLSELLKREVILPEDLMDPHIPNLIENMNPARQLMLLENLRFHPGETKNDAEFAKYLASLADIYINDAFGTAHRAHASVYGMVREFDRDHKAAGYLLGKELECLGDLLKKPARPFIAVMGGAKVSDKLGVMTSLIERVNGLIIGGAMAYTFLKAQGHSVGSSRVEEDLVEKAHEILMKAKSRNVQVALPLDHVVVSNFDDAAGQNTPGVEIPAGKMGLDIGAQTRARYAELLSTAGTVFWNGPMGVFEREAFAQGTMSVARAIASSNAKSVVGGGDSASAIREAGLLDKITHVSTGGGASLEFVEGAALPGIEALRANHPFDLG